MERSDTQLIAGYLAGDDKSLELLFSRYTKPVYNFIYRYIGDAQSAEDLTQDVFVKAWQSIKKSPTAGLFFTGRFNPKKGNFKTWIFSIAKNACLDFLKKKKAIPFSHFENGAGENYILETLADPAPLPQELLDNKNAAAALTAVLEKLAPKYRMVLFLRYNDHFTFREIAQSLGEPLDTVKSRHRRALAMLKKMLEGNNRLVP